MTRSSSNEPDNPGRTILGSVEEELRAEIEQLKRRLHTQQHTHSGAHVLEHPPRPRRAAILGLLLLIAAIFVVAFFAGYVPRHRRELQLVAEANVQQESLPEVSVVAAKRGSLMGNLVLPGNIQAVTEAPILARAEGFILRRYVDIGDKVNAGQLLAEIQAPELDQQVVQARAAVQQSQADLERATAALEQGKANEQLAKVTASRWDNLSKKGVVSRQENDQYQAQYLAQSANVRALDRAVAAAKGNVAASQANVARLGELQGYLQVRAPFAGVITLRNIDVGALVNTGSTLLFRIAQTNPLRTYVNVPQVDAPEVRVGQTATLSTADLPDRKFNGLVTRTANALDPASRTLLVEIQVPNPDGKLMPGTYSQVDLNLPRKEPPLLIPSDTLVVRPAGTLVALVNADSKVHFQPITVGRDLGDRIEVLSGLKAGQRVIVNPNDSVQEGVRVHPVAGK
ncbi:MAG TPA: efflux RND transporter periplasmic adaptor subunit [Bryobacteraceae bacterium]|nr:efflux RND transporter periplasmic adaptor subunit [Bryobacteraceae bacterium]